MKFFDKIFKQNDLSSSLSRQTSKNVAKERLKLALTYDRGGLAHGTIEQLRDEIIEVIAKHLQINNEDIDIHLDRTTEQDKLIASIPLRTNPVSRSRTASPAGREAAPTTESSESISMPRHSH